MGDIFYAKPPYVAFKTSLVGLLVTFYVSADAASVKPDPASLTQLLGLSIEQLLNIPITSTSYFSETTLESGSTVTVLNHEIWEKNGARRIDDAVSNMPGFIPLPSFLGLKLWAVRGFSTSNGSGVQTLWDGVPLNAFPVGTTQVDNANIQLNTLDSIEVIRGPGSALYGSDAFHGVVSLNAYESEDDQQLVSLRLGSNGYADSAYKKSTPLSNDWRLNLAIAAGGQPEQNSKYQYFDQGVKSSSERDSIYDSYTASVKFNSDESKTISYKLGVYYNKYSHDNFFHNGSSVPSNDTSDHESEFAMLKAAATWKLGSHNSLSFDTSLWSQSRDSSRILTPTNNVINIVVEKEDQLAANIVYRHDKLFGNTELAAALGFKSNKLKNAHRTLTNASGAVLNNIFEQALPFEHQSRHVTSALIDAKTQFLDDEYILRYGVRYDRYSDFGGNLSPRLGLIKKLDKKSAIKLLYGNAFRAPTANEFYGAPLLAGNLNLKPETIDTYELAYINQTRTSKFETVLFSSEWNNVIAVVGVNPNRVYQNVGKQKSKGVEVSFLEEYQQWQFDLSGSYVKSEDVTSDVSLSVFPKFIINAGVAYQFKNNWVVRVVNRVHIGASRNPDTPTVIAPKLKDYWRLDVNAIKKYSKKLEVFVNLRNALNRDNQFPTTQGSPVQADFAGGVQDEKISFDAGLRYGF